MIRKILLAILSLAAIGTTVPAGISYLRSVHGHVRLGSRDSVHVRFSEGILRLLAYSSDKPLDFELRTNMLLIKLRETGELVLSIRFVTRGELRRGPRNAIPPISWRRPVPVVNHPPNVQIVSSYVRVPALLPPLLFLAFPLWHAARRRWRMRAYAQGTCTTCGYCLTGNTSGVCPECGALVGLETTRPQGHSSASASSLD